MKKTYLAWLLFSVFLLPSSIRAVCPVCTVAVGAGLGISRWLGIDDVVTSLWIGGLLMSSSLWLASWIKNRPQISQKIFLPTFASIISMYLLVFIPLYLNGNLNLVGNVLWGVDKIVFGTSLGTGLFLLAVATDKILRLFNQGKVFIYYQKVLIPLFYLLFASLIFLKIT